MSSSFFRTCIQDPAVLSLVRGDLQTWYGSTKKLNDSCEADCQMVKCIYTNTTFCDKTEGAFNSTIKLFDIPVKLRKSSSEQYFTKSVLQMSDSIEPADFGTPLWKLSLSLMAAWIIIFFCLMKVNKLNKHFNNYKRCPKNMSIGKFVFSQGTD